MSIRDSLALITKLIYYGTYNDVRDAVARVDDRAGEAPILLLDVRGRPGRCQRKHCLHRDVQAGHVEGLEHDLGSVLAIFGRIQRRLRQRNEMILSVRRDAAR